MFYQINLMIKIKEKCSNLCKRDSDNQRSLEHHLEVHRHVHHSDDISLPSRRLLGLLYRNPTALLERMLEQESPRLLRNHEPTGDRSRRRRCQHYRSARSFRHGRFVACSCRLDSRAYYFPRCALLPEREPQICMH